MPRVQYPNTSQASAFSGPGTIVVYTDTALTTLADISLTSGGSAIGGSTLTLSSLGVIPDFWGPPSDPGVLYARIQGATDEDSDITLTPKTASTSIGAAAGSQINASALSTSFSASSTAVLDVPGWSVLVPANSGPALIWCPTGVSVTLTTGTIAAATSQRLSVYITDDTNPAIPLGFANWVVYGTGTSQNLTTQLPLGCQVPNVAVDRTYRVLLQVQRHGTSGATGAINAGGGVLPDLYLQAVRR